MGIKKTDELVLRLRDLWLSDIPTRDVHRAFSDVSPDTVRVWARDAGLPVKRTWINRASNEHPNMASWPDDRTERMRELWEAQTHSATTIAKKLCEERPDLPIVTSSAVIGKAHRLGLCEKFIGTYAARTHPRRMKPGPQPRPQREGNLAPSPPHGLRSVPRVQPRVEFIQGGCRMICGTDVTRDDFYCGKKIERGSYCAEHARRMYQATKQPDVRNALYWSRR